MPKILMPSAAATGFILIAAVSFGQQIKPAFVREFNWPAPPGSAFPKATTYLAHQDFAILEVA